MALKVIGAGFVPDEPFPRSNDGQSFRERTKLRNFAKLIAQRRDP